MYRKHKESFIYCFSPKKGVCYTKYYVLTTEIEIKSLVKKKIEKQEGNGLPYDVTLHCFQRIQMCLSYSLVDNNNLWHGT